MAKSIRSKAKRTFRAKKREDGIYAATEAARLHRLNAKLVAVASKGEEGNVLEEDTGKEDALGWSWFATLGILDVEDITAESLETLTHTLMTRNGWRGQSGEGADRLKRQRSFF